MTDAVAISFAAWRTWPRGDLRILAAARALPFAFVAFIPADLYYQISMSLGNGREWPTVVIATGLISLSAFQLLALTARTVQDETLINNSVGTILAAAQFELSDPKGGTGAGEAARSTLETIEREALRCARIVRSVLLFARADPGRVADHDLNEIVESSRIATAEYARGRGARVEVWLERGPVAVRGNAVELEQVLVNLIRNAIESRASDAEVHVRVEDSQARAVVLVRDNGTGLSDETKKRLFEPFYTTKLREGGSGLGLSVAHGILMTHGGEIEVVSEMSAGACFRISLPRRGAAG